MKILHEDNQQKRKLLKGMGKIKKKKGHMLEIFFLS